MSQTSFLFGLLFVLLYVGAKSQKTQISHVDVILAGGLGDLSKKYLWQSFFQLFGKYSHENSTFKFYAISRDPYEKGNARLQEILENRVSCPTSEDVTCLEKRKEFLKVVKYFQLTTEIHFTNFELLLDAETENSGEVIRGRIIYLAIPPKNYVNMAEKFSNCCYLRKYPHWTRLVLEKPFGSDKSSAEKMAEEIGKYLKEEDTYRVDHYLGKSVVKQILPFRMANKDTLEPLLNREHVERVEIVMKENFDVKGRFEYYDQYGVVRDVMQNHLTELLALVTMTLPASLTNYEETERNRIKVLRQVESLKKGQLLIGQYSNYLKQAQEEKDNVTMSMFTPTFGAALLHINNPRWQDVPILLVSGKELDERSSYIRIVFRNNDFCVSGCHRNGTHSIGPKQIIFQIGHGSLPSAGLLVSKSLFNPVLPIGLKSLALTSHESIGYGQSLNDFSFSVPVIQNDAYITLIEDVFKGDKKSFVSTERLLALWDIWTGVLDETKLLVPNIYKENSDLLNFKLKNKMIHFIEADLSDSKSFLRGQSSSDDSPPNGVLTSHKPTQFLGHSLTLKPYDDLYITLADSLQSLALSAVDEKNAFHLALSGGRSPVKLFQLLADSYPQFPWKWTHIWQVDERCVDQDSTQLNFNSVHTELLQHIKIPYLNIHPMPVNIGGDVCGSNSVEVYEKLLNDLVPNLELDFVLLGVGADGHTASLFPSSNLLDENSKNVGLTHEETIIPRRMTLLFPVINRAKSIAVVVTGKEKHQIVDQLSEEVRTTQELPILGVSPQNGNVTFYIDHEAWYGK